MELVAQRSGTTVTRVGYTSTPQATLAVIGGEVDMACLPEQAVAAQVQAGKLHALAVASAKRSSVLPGVPTLKQLGMPGIEADSWMGVIAPAGTPCDCRPLPKRDCTGAVATGDTGKAACKFHGGGRFHAGSICQYRP
ncbi:tripartite tricarboxylate transporter substrate-binding protein [Cupriavidus basilensis]